ncbi:twin-arginine translocase TatA/TatE family subunit [Paenibacillus sp. Soil724D2]|uniref:twin-arginine translocase TatA/TatE family subunit n=1 Tax=Paenibacillus sp. (strain Soil724D2) TaxID=1736392 RepID=UPI0007C6FC64|nr:twin-arginine translocase TatA/TatE family subunit [Paenibacillus sp. Soil724D2]
MFQNIGFTELLLIAVVALVLFGPQKLPEIGRVLGRTIRDFKKGAHALLNDEPEEAPKPAAQVKPAPQVSTQGEAASSNAVEAGSPSERAAVAFVTAAPSLVKMAVEPSTATPEVAESDTSATSESEAVHAAVQPEQAMAAAPALTPSVDASSAQSGSSAATAASVPTVIPTDVPSASPAAVSAVEAQSDTSAAPARTDAPPASPAAVSSVDAAPASSGVPAPTSTPRATPITPSSNTRRLPD